MQQEDASMPKRLKLRFNAAQQLRSIEIQSLSKHGRNQGTVSLPDRNSVWQRYFRFAKRIDVYRDARALLGRQVSNWMDTLVFASSFRFG